MLVLTRKSGQEIKIGEEITIAILELKGKQVRLGITAPKTYNIKRSELPDRITLERHDFKNIDDAMTFIGEELLKPENPERGEEDV